MSRSERRNGFDRHSSFEAGHHAGSAAQTLFPRHVLKKLPGRYTKEKVYLVKNKTQINSKILLYGLDSLKLVSQTRLILLTGETFC